MLLVDFGFAPLLHSETITWDEYLVLAVGIILISLVGYLGRFSKSAKDEQRQIIGSPNGATLRQRRSLIIRDISHRYGPQWVLTRLSLEVLAGQCLSILGPNGAGKSTLLHIIATLTEPTAGDLLIGTTSLQANPLGIKRHIGLVSHKPLLYPHLTAWENLQLFGHLYRVNQQTQRAEVLLQRVQLWQHRHKPVKSLSHGQKQRVAIARALLHNPNVLLLDEPYSGLDLRAAEQLDDILAELIDLGHTLLITTHDLQRSLMRSGQVIILARGRLIYQANTDEVTLETLQRVYRQVFTVSSDPTYE